MTYKVALAYLTVVEKGNVKRDLLCWAELTQEPYAKRAYSFLIL